MENIQGLDLSIEANEISSALHSIDMHKICNILNKICQFMEISRENYIRTVGFYTLLSNKLLAWSFLLPRSNIQPQGQRGEDDNGILMGQVTETLNVAYKLASSNPSYITANIIT